MNRIVAHSTLRMDPDVRDFLTMDTDLPKASGTSALSAAGVMRLFGKVGDAVTKLSANMTETDQVCLFVISTVCHLSTTSLVMSSYFTWRLFSCL